MSGHPGVIHQDIDLAELLHGLIDDIIDIILDGDIATQGQGAPPKFLNFLGGFGQLAVVSHAVADNQVSPGFSHAQSNGLAQALPGPGDDDYFTLQMSSQCLLSYTQL